jgi:hypothetical protein
VYPSDAVGDPLLLLHLLHVLFAIPGVQQYRYSMDGNLIRELVVFVKSQPARVYRCQERRFGREFGLGGLKMLDEEVDLNLEFIECHHSLGKKRGLVE